jgi:diguanylate cyclase (GGDEF)-like protein/PAS domain S-box-containing protein
MLMSAAMAARRRRRKGVRMSDEAAGPERADGGVPDEAVKALAARLRAVEGALDELLEHTSDLAHLVDADGRLVAVNRAWRQALGIGGDTPDAKGLEVFLPPERREAYREACGRVLADGAPVTLSATFRAWDGRLVEALGRLSRHERADGPIVCGLFHDVTAQRFQESRASHVATRDPLTSLANRAYFLQHLPLALARAKRQGTLVGVVALDLDHFRDLNAYFGHAGGDEALIAVGDRLKRSVRTEDLVARFGGDRFALVLERLHTAADATFVVERALATITTPLLTHTGEWVRPSASIGVALGDGSAEGVETLLRGAERAMVRAKRAGGERFIFAERDEMGDIGMADAIR